MECKEEEEEEVGKVAKPSLTLCSISSVLSIARRKTSSNSNSYWFEVDDTCLCWAFAFQTLQVHCLRRWWLLVALKTVSLDFVATMALA